jgi:pyruvate ferredoxin oxidoreductase alpha subunit
VRVGCVGIKAFRPWPEAEVRDALQRATRVIVVEKALSVGIGGIVSQNVHSALEGSDVKIHTAIAGLGGRPITSASIHRLVNDAIAGRLEHGITFVDLNRELVDRELQRTLRRRRSGPHAENMLRDLGAVAAGPV